MPTLVSLHTLFVREHNRIAAALRQRRSDWSDEDLYQQARRINIAQFQNIVYNEYLPLVLGPSSVHGSKLDLDDTEYDPTADPSVINSFSTAAYRQEEIFRCKICKT